METFIIVGLCGFVAGFIVGALVYRNNAKAANKAITDAQNLAAQAKAEAANVKAAAAKLGVKI